MSTHEPGCKPGGACSWMCDRWLGGCSGDVAQAADFAREVADEWQRPVVVRLDGGRTVNEDGTPNPDGKLLWTVYVRDAKEDA